MVKKQPDFNIMGFHLNVYIFVMHVHVLNCVMGVTPLTSVAVVDPEGVHGVRLNPNHPCSPFLNETIWSQ